eukprot:m.924733 g.924733  ORF g.924733 m.924733 type:complete len:865 (+) comp23771_c0_seq1:115-2709(+)
MNSKNSEEPPLPQHDASFDSKVLGSGVAVPNIRDYVAKVEIEMATSPGPQSPLSSWMPSASDDAHMLSIHEASTFIGHASATDNPLVTDDNTSLPPSPILTPDGDLRKRKTYMTTGPHSTVLGVNCKADARKNTEFVTNVTDATDIALQMNEAMPPLPTIDVYCSMEDDLVHFCSTKIETSTSLSPVSVKTNLKPDTSRTNPEGAVQRSGKQTNERQKKDGGNTSAVSAAQRSAGDWKVPNPLSHSDLETDSCRNEPSAAAEGITGSSQYLDSRFVIDDLFSDGSGTSHSDDGDVLATSSDEELDNAADAVCTERRKRRARKSCGPRPPPLKYKVMGPKPIKDVLAALGWEEHNPAEDLESDYNFWWKGGEFRKFEVEDCKPWQRLNHFPKTNAICKKDCLARILRKMVGVYGRTFNFMPQSFILPKDKDKFRDFYEAEQSDDSVWICKPSYGSQGTGIYLFKHPSELKVEALSCVVQRYVANPLLIEGYKFDLRIYVAVTSFHPLKLYLYEEGLTRFSTQKYDMSNLDNPFSHLTNTSINKHSPTVADTKGCVGAGSKWTLGQLRAYFARVGIDDRMMWQRISHLIALTMLSVVQEVPVSGAGTVELTGFDVLIDETMRPWLLEVNSAPSLSQDCVADEVVKPPLIEDLIGLCQFKRSDGWRGRPPQTSPDRNHIRSRREATTTPTRAALKCISPTKSLRKTTVKKITSVANTLGGSQGNSGGPSVRLSTASILRASSLAAQKKAQQERAAVQQERSRTRASKVFVPPPKTRKEAPALRQENEAKMPSEIPLRMGKFARVFPFNDATYQAASGLRKRFDMKRILSEYKELLAKFKAEFAGKHTDTPETDRAYLDFMYTPMCLT